MVIPEITECTPGCTLLGLSAALAFTPAEPLASDLDFYGKTPGMGRAPMPEEAVAWRNLEHGLQESLKL